MSTQNPMGPGGATGPQPQYAPPAATGQQPQAQYAPQQVYVPVVPEAPHGNAAAPVALLLGILALLSNIAPWIAYVIISNTASSWASSGAVPDVAWIPWVSLGGPGLGLIAVVFGAIGLGFARTRGRGAATAGVGFGLGFALFVAWAVRFFIALSYNDWNFQYGLAAMLSSF